MKADEAHETLLNRERWTRVYSYLRNCFASVVLLLHLLAFAALLTSSSSLFCLISSCCFSLRMLNYKLVTFLRARAFTSIALVTFVQPRLPQSCSFDAHSCHFQLDLLCFPFSFLPAFLPASSLSSSSSTPVLSDPLLSQIPSSPFSVSCSCSFSSSCLVNGYICALDS